MEPVSNPFSTLSASASKQAEAQPQDVAVTRLGDGKWYALKTEYGYLRSGRKGQPLELSETVGEDTIWRVSVLERGKVVQFINPDGNALGQKNIGNVLKPEFQLVAQGGKGPAARWVVNIESSGEALLRCWVRVKHNEETTAWPAEFEEIDASQFR